MSLELFEHLNYLTDPVRMLAFRQAIHKIVKPNSIVLDLGAGTGILGFLACQAGAKRVYSVDSGAIIEVLRQIARTNDYEDRVICIKGRSTEVTLPEQVDVVVADQLAYFGFGAGL